MQRCRVVVVVGWLVAGLPSLAWADLDKVYPAQAVKGMQLVFRVQGFSAGQVTEQGDNLDASKNRGGAAPRSMHQRISGTVQATSITIEGQLVLSAPGEYSYGVWLKTDRLNPPTQNRADNHREAQDAGRFKGPAKRSFKVVLPLLAGQQYLTWEVALSGPLNNPDYGAVRVSGLADTSSPGAPRATPANKLYQIRQLYVAHFNNRPSPFAERGVHPGIWAGTCALVMPAKFDPYACGSYQREVLALFDGLRFSQSPDQQQLMADFDYGPIQALGGGHQAVVLWQKGQTWTTDGLVFDPWITQTPEVYAMEDWALQFSGGSYHGVGPSSTYTIAPYYPTHGGQYANLNAPGQSSAEKQWLASLPEAKRAVTRRWPPHIVDAYVREQYQKSLLTRVFQAHCPLEIALVDSRGRLTGYRDGQPLLQIPGVLMVRFPTSDGGYWTRLEFPGNQTFRLVGKGLGAGRANLLAGYGVNRDDPPVLQHYAITLAAGTRVELAAINANAPCQVGDQTVQPQPFQLESARSWSGLKRPRLWLPPGEDELSITPRTEPAPAAKPSGPARYLFDSRNPAGVKSGPPPQPTVFTLQQATRVEQIRTYHYQNGQGATPGTIALQGPDGKRHGPWPAKGIGDNAGRQNLFWEVLPNVMVPAGRYTIIVSAPATWSHNPQSNNAGIALVWGTPY